MPPGSSRTKTVISYEIAIVAAVAMAGVFILHRRDSGIFGDFATYLCVKFLGVPIGLSVLAFVQTQRI